MRSFGVLAARPSRRRLWVVLLAVLAMVSPLAAAPAAQAATSSVSLSVSPSVAAPAESVVLSGVVSPAAAGRTVWLQRYGTSWLTVATVATTATGSFSGSVRAGVAGSKTSWRAVAAKSGTDTQAISLTRVLLVVKAAVSLTAPVSVETRLAFTLSGVGYPVRAGRTVVVQRLSGSTWVEVGRTIESATGGYSARTSLAGVGKFTFRTVALTWRGAATVVSPSRVVSARAPYILLTPSSAIAAETVKVTGKLPGVYLRPVWVQRKSGTSWVTLVKTTTTSAGSYATAFRAPAAGSYAVRALAPQVTIAGKVRSYYLTAAKTLSVVAQSASLTLPTTLVQAKTGTATLKFAPVRAGRAVALLVLRSGVWTSVATGKQSASGTASLTVTAGTPGPYSYRAWTAAAAGAPAFASPTRAVTVIADLGPVTNVTATPARTSIALTWTNPTATTLTGVMIRRALGAIPPVSATAGTLVTDAVKPATSFTDTGLASGTKYAYALFAHNATPTYATAAVTSTTTAAGPPGSVSGTVTDAGGTQRGLAGVKVEAYSYYPYVSEEATTAADGTYTITGLTPATDFNVCFTSSRAAGGSSDATGYLSQCWKAPVAVTAGENTTGINAVLAHGAAVSGTVTDAGGVRRGLANVEVEVFSSIGSTGPSTTAADGTYTVKGVAPGTQTTVCFTAGSGVTGGSSDASGYTDQCYDNQPDGSVPTQVAVAVGVTTTGINAALDMGGAVSGKVTDIGGTHQGLGGVSVSVQSGTPFGSSRTTTTAADGTYTLTGLSAATDYEVNFSPSFNRVTGGSSDATGYIDQSYNNQPAFSPTPVFVVAGVITTGINAALAAAGGVSGAVTDAAYRGLGGVQVYVWALNDSKAVSAWTAADGSWSLPWLTPGAGYTICFDASSATGSSATGYLYQCWQRQLEVTATPVSVRAGVFTTGINAALASGGAISGSVTDAGGTHKGLGGVSVEVRSLSTGGYGFGRTSADGSYIVTGLSSATDYKVCLDASGATGGSSDAAGYLDECYDNQPASGTPTPVKVTANEITRGISAALVASAG